MPTPILDVELIAQSSSEYLTQVFTGFGALEAQGWLRLRATRAANYVPGVKYQPRLRAVINGSLRVAYDLRDIPDPYPDDLDWAHVYFKRSYSPVHLAGTPGCERIHPYGLNYPVYGPHDHAGQRVMWSLQSLRRQHSRKNILHTIDQALRSSDLLSRLTNRENCRANCDQHVFEDTPRFEREARINYYARLWDPAGVVAEYQENCDAVNSTRIGCVRALRQAFGARFDGGIQISTYARQVAPNLIADYRQTLKPSYLRKTRQANICVTTLGVVGSNGWRIGELVAGAKAIVCERLCTFPPGNFAPERNYLEFGTPEECVQQVQRLVDDPALRYALAVNNAQYYQQYLRPDRLIWNTLQVALGTNAIDG